MWPLQFASAFLPNSYISSVSLRTKTFSSLFLVFFQTQNVSPTLQISLFYVSEDSTHADSTNSFPLMIFFLAVRLPVFVRGTWIVVKGKEQAYPIPEMLLRELVFIGCIAVAFSCKCRKVPANEAYFNADWGDTFELNSYLFWLVRYLFGLVFMHVGWHNPC